MVVVAQLVRALDCGSRGRRFETGLPPQTLSLVSDNKAFFLSKILLLSLFAHFIDHHSLISVGHLPGRIENQTGTVLQ